MQNANVFTIYDIEIRCKTFITASKRLRFSKYSKNQKTLQKICMYLAQKHTLIKCHPDNIIICIIATNLLTRHDKSVKAESSNTSECTSLVALWVGCAQSRHAIITFLEFTESIQVMYSTRAPGRPNKRPKKKKKTKPTSKQCNQQLWQN